MTPAQTKALRWLVQHNGTGVFESNNSVLVAGGCRADVMRATWNALRDLGHVEIATKRVTVTDQGRANAGADLR